MSLLNYSQHQEEASSFYNDDSSRINEFKNLINKNSKSSRLNFPSIPFTKTIYGCYESNSQFNYGFSPEFDLSFLRKHDLPVCDQVIVLTEIRVVNECYFLISLPGERYPGRDQHPAQPGSSQQSIGQSTDYQASDNEVSGGRNLRCFRRYKHYESYAP